MSFSALEDLAGAFFAKVGIFCVKGDEKKFRVRSNWQKTVESSDGQLVGSVNRLADLQGGRFLHNSVFGAHWRSRKKSPSRTRAQNSWEKADLVLKFWESAIARSGIFRNKYDFSRNSFFDDCWIHTLLAF